MSEDSVFSAILIWIIVKRVWRKFSLTLSGRINVIPSSEKCPLEVKDFAFGVEQAGAKGNLISSNLFKKKLDEAVSFLNKYCLIYQWLLFYR